MRIFPEKKFPNFGITGKLTTCILCLSVFPILVTTAYVYYNAKQSIEDRVIAHLTSIAELKDRELEMWLSERVNDLQGYASSAALTNYLSKRSSEGVSVNSLKQIQNNLHIRQELHSYTHTFITDNAGVVIASTKDDQIGSTLAEPFIKEVVERKKIIVDDLFLDAGNTLTMRFSAPVVGSHDTPLAGEVIGIYAFELNFSDTVGKIIGYWPGMGDTGETLLVQRRGDQIVFLNEIRHKRVTALNYKIPITSKSALPAILASDGNEGFIRAFDYRQKKVLAAYRHIPMANWGFVAKIDQAEAFGAITAMRNHILLVTALLIILGIGITIWFSHGITHPIKELKDAIEHLTSGEFRALPSLNRGDEIGGLSKSFTTMAQEIKESRTELTSINHSLQKQTRELTKSRNEAEEANIAKSRFLANMFHEIRTPMNAILGFTDILKSKEHNPQKARYIESIHASGHALLSLINDILDLSKIEAGKLDLQYTATSLQNLFDEMQLLFSQKVVDNGMNFIVEISGDVPAALVLDEKRVRQVLINLLSNAIKFTESGCIRLSATARSLDNENLSRVEVVIEVQDTGIGIPDDQLEHIFGAFTQTKGQKIAQFGGTGLGLAIIKRLVDLMDGDIKVESELQKGSAFRITLHDVEVASATSVKEKKSRCMDFSNLNFAPAKLLIVDDIDFNRELLASYLDEWLFELIYAENGKEAIEKAYEYRPDIILLDMKMPVMDGYEASKILHDELSQIPIIAVTASALKQDEDIISKLCDGYLRKPVEKEDLMIELRKFLTHTVNDEISDPADQASEETRDTLPIPEEILLSLQEDSLIGDIECVHGDINRIMEYDHILAKKLQSAAEKFDYLIIIELCKAYQDSR